jgi:hypothetical protein
MEQKKLIKIILSCTTIFNLVNGVQRKSNVFLPGYILCVQIPGKWRIPMHLQAGLLFIFV